MVIDEREEDKGAGKDSYYAWLMSRPGKPTKEGKDVKSDKRPKPPKVDRG